MKTAILHLSDFHITDPKFCERTVESLLQVNGQDANDAFFTGLIAKIKTFSPKVEYIVISGDITNSAEVTEFQVAEKLITRLLTELKISPNNCLLIPGDHEVHRPTLEYERRLPENIGKETSQMNEVKFRNFSKFYKAIKQKEFDCNALIYDEFTIGNVVFLAANSNYNVGHRSAFGFFPVEELRKSLADTENRLQNHHKVIVFHHNLAASYDDKQSGQWDSINRRDVIPLFESYNLKLLLFGNEHTPTSRALDNTGIYFSEPGALSGKNPSGSFKIYELQSDPSRIVFKNHFFDNRQKNSHQEPTTGTFVKIDVAELKGTELAEFEIYKKENHKLVEPLSLPENEPTIEATSIEIAEVPPVPVVYTNSAIQDRLYQIVREKKLFHSGHFHWSESSRAHNWIDVARLLEDNRDLFFVQKSIVDVIDQFELDKDCDLIIGLGAEGNVISTKAAIYFGKPYTSLPYSYRYDDSHSFERKLNFDNGSGVYKTVMIICDVVNDGRTLRKLVGSHEKEFFDNVEKIIVVSLFYTGLAEEISNNILNYNKLPKDHDGSDDFQVDRIEFYFIKALRIEKCPYGSEYRKECFIFRDELSCVHLFYDEEQAAAINISD